MTNQDFCYWLQGYFEIRASNDALTTTQIEIISRHVDLCEASNAPGPGVLAIKALLPLATGNEAVTSAIQSVLAGVFQHVIDPKDGADSKKLQHIHNGGRPGPVMRC